MAIGEMPFMQNGSGIDAPTAQGGGFASLLGRLLGGGNAAPMGAPAQPSSPMGGGGFSNAFASDGGLAQAGWIGKLLTAGNPSRQENAMAMAAQEESDAANFIQKQIASGIHPQKAILSYVQSPQGVKFLAKGGDPSNLMNYAKLAIDPDIQAKRRAQIMGVGGQSAPQTAQPYMEEMAGGGAIADARTAMRGGASGPTIAGNPVSVQPPVAVASTADGQPAANAPATGANNAAPGGLASRQDYVNAAARAAAAGDLELAKFLQDQASAIDPRPQTQIDMGMKKENIVLQEQVRVQGKAAEEAQKEAQTIRGILPALETAARISDKVPDSWAAQVKLQAGRMASALGIKVDGLGEVEALNAVGMQLIGLVRQPGAVSNYEQMAYMNAVPSLSQTQQGRKMILDMITKIAKNKLEVAKVMEETIGDPERAAKLAALDTKNIFTPEEHKAIGFDASNPQAALDAVPAAPAAPGALTAKLREDGAQWSEDDKKWFKLKSPDANPKDKKSWIEAGASEEAAPPAAAAAAPTQAPAAVPAYNYPAFSMPASAPAAQAPAPSFPPTANQTPFSSLSTIEPGDAGLLEILRRQEIWRKTFGNSQFEGGRHRLGREAQEGLGGKVR